MSTQANNLGNMTVLINKNIKEVIAAYPPVGAILEEFGIGCVSCSVGTCLLKDVITIHALSAEQEQALFARIARVVFPGATVTLPKTERQDSPRPGARKFSPPMQKLVEEHACIKRLLALIPKVVALLATGLDPARKRTVADVCDFIRNYADRHHHAKEEDILFKYFDENLDILKVIRQDHEAARAHARAIAEAVEREDTDGVAEHLNAYKDLLTEHIKKEDEILYPWMDRELSDSQIGQLYTKFRTVDERFGDKPTSYLALAAELEKTIA